LYTPFLGRGAVDRIDSFANNRYNDLALDYFRSPRLLAWETMEPYTLLVVARTQSLAKRLRDALGAERYVIRWAPSATQALELDLRPSLLVLKLPASGGARCVARLKRGFDAPLLAICSPDQPLPAQVDSCLYQPCRTRDLVDLVETMLINHAPHMVCAADMSLDVESRRLQINGAVHQLRPIACRILAVLMARAGEVVPRDELFRRVWGTEDGDNTRALDVHIAHLRSELESDPRQPRLIVTERGVGYRLTPP